MLKNLWEVAKELGRSKKAAATVAAMFVWALGRFGLHVDQSDLLPLVAPLLAYIVGQGVADAGKEAAKLKQ